LETLPQSSAELSVLSYVIGKPWAQVAEAISWMKSGEEFAMITPGLYRSSDR
jgi:hypothetical protein